MTEPALGRVPWAPRCLLKLEVFSFVFLFVCLILSLGVKCLETRDRGEGCLRVLPPVHHHPKPGDASGSYKPPSLPCSCSPAAQPHPKDSWERLREGAGARPAAGSGWVGGGL